MTTINLIDRTGLGLAQDDLLSGAFLTVETRRSRIRPLDLDRTDQA